ncbi:MAG: ATP-binding cassette domain-containing protein [Gammaproteobacteria bacterium]|nr:MAG: ATP-binding cassette domain-containing protein [Gammaproteobacteria bacterium]
MRASPRTSMRDSTRSKSFIPITTTPQPIATAASPRVSRCWSPEAPTSTAIRRTAGSPVPCRFRPTTGCGSATRPRMPDSTGAAIELRDVQKDYHSLRPLRVRTLDVREGESIALLGFDRAAAEVFVNLITGATVPDSGEVRVFGRPTAAIQDARSWLDALDCFGILSERAVVLDNMTVEDNLAMTLTMSLHDVDAAMRAKVHAIADEVGLRREQLSKPVAALSLGGRLRLRLGRALAPDPRILLAEHPNALLEPADVRSRRAPSRFSPRRASSSHCPCGSDCSDSTSMEQNLI